MSPLLDLAIRSAAILTLGLTAEWLLRARPAALRHFVLASAIAGAFAIVPLSLVLPAWELTLPAPQVSAALPSTPRSLPPATRALNDSSRSAAASAEAVRQAPIAALTWFAGFVFAAAALMAGVYRLTRTARAGRPSADARWNHMAREIALSYGIKRDVRLIQTDARDLLATWGVRRPSVLLPSHARGWSDERMHVVLCHELAHIRRHDWPVQIAAEVLRTVLWFNPLIWITCTRLRRAGEQACDDAVLGRGVAARDYAAHLLALARQCRRPSARWASAVPMAHPSTLERRIVAMLDPRLNRQALSRRAIAAVAAALVVFLLPVAAVRARQASPSAFSGAVYDTTGAVMPGVTVTLEDAASAKQSTVTDKSGRFQFPAVAAGEWVLSAKLPGFRELRQEFKLLNSRDWDKAITLQVGTVSESITVSSTRITAAATAPRPQMPAPVRVGGNIRVPRKLQDVRPIYPDSMRTAAREGVVPLDAIIGEDGSVTSVRVLSADVHPDFAIAAVDAVRQWRFSPTLLNGKPIEVVMTVTIAFSLSN